MNMPTLPTDNLYKFVALSGVALVIVGILIPIRSQEDIDRRWARKLDLLLMVQAELATVRWEAALYEKDASGRPAKFTEARLAEMEKVIAHLERVTEAMKTLEAELRPSVFLTDLGIARRRAIVAVCVGILGLGMMICGFFFWYRRTQRYQDRIIANQAGQVLARK